MKSITHNPQEVSIFPHEEIIQSGLTSNEEVVDPIAQGLRFAACGRARPHGLRQARARKPACSPDMAEWVTIADDLFNGDGRLYGFIVTNNNSYTESYGFDQLYEPISKKPDVSQIEVIKGLKGKKKRLIGYEYGFIREKNIYEWFADLVNRQNNTGARLTNPEGKEIIALNGRFCNRKGRRSVQVQKVFKSGIGEIKDCILLTLTTHQKEVQRFMPENSNYSPVQYATVKVGEWVSGFLNRFRQWQRVRGLPWEFVGWTIEFQEGDEKIHGKDPLKMHNGFVHIHMIFRGKWIGKIQEIAKLWPYCELQGVDYMDRTKYERELRSKGKLRPGQHVSGVRLVNYVTAYVSKCSKAVVIRDGRVYVHKGYAWLAYTCGRMFNVAREYKRSEKKKIVHEDEEKTFQQRYTRTLKEGWQYGGVQMYQTETKEVSDMHKRAVGTG